MHPTPVIKDLVLLGGGHSHVAVLRAFGMKPMPGVRLTLVCRDLHTPYSGMLPGYVAGHYGFDEAHIDLRPLARFAGARVVHDEAIGLDAAGRRLSFRARPPLPYDLLSLNIGTRPSLAALGGAGAAGVTPVKPVDRFVAYWDDLAAQVVGTRVRLRLGVVGGGAGGFELALAARHRLGGSPGDDAAVGLEVHLVTDSADILPSHNGRVRTTMRRILAARGVQLHTGHRVIEAGEGFVRCANGVRLELDVVLWVTEAAPAPWLRDSGLALDEAGFVQVDACLRAVSHPEVFAAGDIAAMAHEPRERAGVYAVRAGRPLTRNLRRALLDRPLRPFRPQQRHLALIGTGPRHAVASRGPFVAAGTWVWRWKEGIDRRFMRRYSDLPAMDEGPNAASRFVDTSSSARALGMKPGSDFQGDTDDRAALAELTAAAMRCGGCGAKLPGDVLARVLNRLGAGAARDDVPIGLAAPDDAAVLAVPEGRHLVQSVDFFRDFLGDPWLFGEIAATHALGDLHAMGAEPRWALALATLPPGLPAKLEEELYQMLAGARRALEAGGATLVGGHSGEAAEPALGFAVSGLAEPGRLMTKGGMRPGDRLVLTKPLGTGTLFAAEARGKAKGRWIAAAVESMRRSNGAAARCLMAHGATACTDVTGFGLLGHLVEMTRAAGTAVELELDALPILEGALDCAAAGHLSSLHPANLRAVAEAIGEVSPAARRHPNYALLFDPQTSGGLLASVPAGEAEACVGELSGLGYDDVRDIGIVRESARSPQIIRVKA